MDCHQLKVGDGERVSGDLADIRTLEPVGSSQWQFSTGFFRTDQLC